jgi:hypothetical protein
VQPTGMNKEKDAKKKSPKILYTQYGQSLKAVQPTGLLKKKEREHSFFYHKKKSCT